jgi:hypothetical protein
MVRIPNRNIYIQTFPISGIENFVGVKKMANKKNKRKTISATTTIQETMEILEDAIEITRIMEETAGKIIIEYNIR